MPDTLEIDCDIGDLSSMRTVYEAMRRGENVYVRLCPPKSGHSIQDSSVGDLPTRIGEHENMNPYEMAGVSTWMADELIAEDAEERPPVNQRRKLSDKECSQRKKKRRAERQARKTNRRR